MTRCTRCSGDLLDLAVFCPGCGQPHEPDFDQLLQRSLSARYTITERLGKGGLSTVFIAHDTHTDQQVVVKVSDPRQLVRHAPPEAFDSTELRHYWMEMLTRMRREVVALVNVQHPNIVRIFDTDLITDELRYIVMERLQGQMLREVLTARGRFELREAIHLTAAITSGLSEVHARGIVHRDLNPRNLLIADGGWRMADCAGQSTDSLTANDGEETFAGSRQSTIHNPPSAIRHLQSAIVKIIDFGIARIPQPPGLPPFTQYAVMSGTVSYASPEQCQNLPLDHRSDIYSLGVVLYEMVTGQRPFTGLTPTEIALKQIQHDPVSPRLFVPDLPLGFEVALLSALAKDPAKRPQTVEAFAAELHPFRDGYTARVVVPLSGNSRQAETLAQILGEWPNATPASASVAEAATANQNPEADAATINRHSAVVPELPELHFTTLAPPRRHRAMVATVIVLTLIAAGLLYGNQLLSTLQSSLATAFPEAVRHHQPDDREANLSGVTEALNPAGAGPPRPDSSRLTPTGSSASVQSFANLTGSPSSLLPGKTPNETTLAASTSSLTGDIFSSAAPLPWSRMSPPLAQPQMPPVVVPDIMVASDPPPKSSPAETHGPVRESTGETDSGSFGTSQRDRRVIQSSQEYAPPLSQHRDERRDPPPEDNRDWNRNHRANERVNDHDDDRAENDLNHDSAVNADSAPKVITWSGEVNSEREVRLELPGTPGTINIPRPYRKRVGLVEAPGPRNRWRCVVLRVFGHGRTSVVVQWWPSQRQFTQSAGGLMNRRIISPFGQATRAMVRQVSHLRR